MDSGDSSRGVRPTLALALMTCALCAVLLGAASDGWCQQLIWRDYGDSTGTSTNADEFGATLASADINGDGKMDLLIGAPGYDDAGDGKVWGAIYAVLGPVSSTSQKQLLVTGADLFETAPTGLGQSLAIVTDYNDNEPLLILVGAPIVVEGNNSNAGGAYLLEYNPGTGQLEAYAEADTSGKDTNDFFGRSTASVGDFNKDGYGDFIVGSSIIDNNRPKAALFLGGSSADPSLPSAHFWSTDSSRAGDRVHGVGDIDGDGWDDLALADYQVSTRGRLNVFLGSTTVPDSIHVDDDDFTIYGEASSSTGYHVAGGYDVTGNRAGDLVLAGNSIDYGVCIFEGPWTTSSTWDSLKYATTIISGMGASSAGHYGSGIDISGDVDGDEYHDLIVTRTNAKEVRVLRGGIHLGMVGSANLSGTSSIKRVVSSSDIPVGYKFGQSVAVGDYTDDDRADLAVGAGKHSGSQLPGVVSIYDMAPSRVEKKGDEIVGTSNLNYVGEPYSAVFFDYVDTNDVLTQKLFVSVQGSGSANKGKLFLVGSVDATSGVSEFDDWTNVDDGFVGIDDIPTPDMRGVAAADVDNDGYWDLIVGAPAGTSADDGTRLYIQQESGKFRDDADQIVIDESSTDLKTAVQDALALSWSDYDRDGQVDLLVTTKDSSGDGLAPILLRNRLGEVGDFSDVSTEVGIELASDSGVLSRAVAWGDYDGDNDLDLFIGDLESISPESRFYENNMPISRDFTEISSTLFSSSPPGVNSATWFDVDHNGYADLVTGMDWSFPVSYVWASNGSALSNHSVATDGPCLGLMPVDYDYDGRVELLALPEASFDTMLVSRAVLTAIDSFEVREIKGTKDLKIAGPIHYALTEDLGGAEGERDGDVDLLLGKSLGVEGSDPSAVLLQNLFADMDSVVADIEAVDKSPTNNWVGVYLVGGGGNNKAGIGAKVECEYNDPVLYTVTQTQWVDGGSMRGSQRSHVLRFGLGEFDGTVGITVTWPDGSVQPVSPVTKNQVNVIEDDTLVGLRESTQTASRVFLANDNVLWTFTWETDYATLRGYSGVEVASTNPGCGIGSTSDPMFLSSFDGDVEYAMEAKLNSSGIQGYKHTLKWEQSCTLACPVLYKMTAKQDFGDLEKSSSWTTIVGPKVCPTQ